MPQSPPFQYPVWAQGMVRDPATITDAELVQRFTIVDTHSGRQYRLDEPLPPMLGQDAALPNGEASANIDPANSNFLRGGFGSMNNYRNGYRERPWDTRVGTIELQVPRVRDGSFFPSLLERRRRAERAQTACRASARSGRPEGVRQGCLDAARG